MLVVWELLLWIECGRICLCGVLLCYVCEFCLVDLFVFDLLLLFVFGNGCLPMFDRV